MTLMVDAKLLRTELDIEGRARAGPLRRRLCEREACGTSGDRSRSRSR